ncbi:hypothetical protein C8R30_102139 [Nitrosomonas nitrosa]|uniref:Uncharacterized protein n=1 Tax=Nitrosomonas nitrosa TaxID=52442 RepID=A0A1I4KZ91_9PROT|nr:hypothetical protein C8R30_102139 [Nitrosomonas nitrosa]SFL84060.1 hypothetical protein SAMN05421880_101105 [Nitrosomonas nitrosa]
MSPLSLNRKVRQNQKNDDRLGGILNIMGTASRYRLLEGEELS